MPLKYVYANGNPWVRNLPDCTIRNLALASNWGYREICKKLKVECKDGYGYTKKEGAADLKKIIRTFENSLFDIVRVDDIFEKNWSSLYHQKDEYDDEFVDPGKGDTISETAAYLKRSNPGRYLFVIRPPEALRKTGEETSFHSTYVDLNANKIFDTFLPDVNSLVEGFMRIKESAIMSKDNPKSLTEEIRLINRGELWGDECPWCFTKQVWKKEILPEIRRRVKAGEKVPSLYNYMSNLDRTK